MRPPFCRNTYNISSFSEYFTDTSAPPLLKWEMWWKIWAIKALNLVQYLSLQRLDYLVRFVRKPYIAWISLFCKRLFFRVIHDFVSYSLYQPTTPVPDQNNRGQTNCSFIMYLRSQLFLTFITYSTVCSYFLLSFHQLQK